MSTAVIVDAIRSPMAKGKAAKDGKPGGALSSVHPVDLLGQVLRALVDRNGIDSATVDDNRATVWARNRNRHNLIREFRSPRADVRARGILIEGLAVQLPTRGDKLSRYALRDETRCIPVRYRWTVGVLSDSRGEHRDSAHRFDAGGDHDVIHAGDDALRAKVGRLLT